MSDATQPERQLQNYWRIVEDRGDKPKPAFVVFDRMTGSIRTWSLDRREMVRWCKSLSFSPSLYRLVRVLPESF